MTLVSWGVHGSDHIAGEQRADNLLFLNNYIKALAALLPSWGVLAVEFEKELLDGMPKSGKKVNIKRNEL